MEEVIQRTGNKAPRSPEKVAQLPNAALLWAAFSQRGAVSKHERMSVGGQVRS